MSGLFVARWAAGLWSGGQLVERWGLQRGLRLAAGSFACPLDTLSSLALVAWRRSRGQGPAANGFLGGRRERAGNDGVLRRHRLIETFLVNVLKMDWSAVHPEAERLEHAISDEVLDRLDALLGHPATDPHGDPIPSAQGKLSTEVHATLATCATGKPLRVVRVTEQSAEFLHFAEVHGLAPGATVRVTDRNLAAGLVTVKKSTGHALALSLAAAGKILVAPVQ